MFGKVFSICLILVICISGIAAANTILLAPTGTTLTTGQIRAEAALSPDNENGKYYWFATGFQQFEASIIRYENVLGTDENQFSGQWNFIPETFLTPAISFGVTDVTSQSKEGIGAYAAITKHLPIGRFSSLLKDLAVSGGVGIKGINGPFFGLEAKLPANLFLQFEYDSRDFNGAVGWQPVSLFRVKGSSIRNEFYFGAEIVPVQF